MLYKFVKRSTTIFAAAIILTYILINSLTPYAHATFPEDWDGDEIDNDIDPCVMIEPSQIDEDEDDIDDACDPIIGEIPDEDSEEQAALYQPFSNQYVLAFNLSKYIKPEEHIHA